jgi:hypothetical protein
LQTVVVSVLHANASHVSSGGGGTMGAAASAIAATVDSKRGETRKTKTTMCLGKEHVWDEQLVLGKRRHIMTHDSIDITVRDEGSSQRRVLGHITLALNGIDAQFDTSTSSDQQSSETVFTGLYGTDSRMARWISLGGSSAGSSVLAQSARRAIPSRSGSNTTQSGGTATAVGDILICAWWVDPVAAAQRTQLMSAVATGGGAAAGVPRLPSSMFSFSGLTSLNQQEQAASQIYPTDASVAVGDGDHKTASNAK